jgi:hypothetical protein
MPVRYETLPEGFRRDADTTMMLTEIRQLNLVYETAEPGSRKESEAAEAVTRLIAELDAAICDGAHLPVPWQRAQYPAEVTVTLSSPKKENTNDT